MDSSKEKSINLILLGLTLKFAPLVVLGMFSGYLKNVFPIFNLLIVLSILVIFVIGYKYFLKGCFLYTESKGYSSITLPSLPRYTHILLLKICGFKDEELPQQIEKRYNLGRLGLLSLVGLSILLLIPSKNNLASLQNESCSHHPLEKINIPELLLTFLIAIPIAIIVLCTSILAIFRIWNNFSLSILFKNKTFLEVLNIISYVFGTFILLRPFQSKEIIVNKIIGYKNKYHWKMLSMAIFIKCAFSISFSSLILYSLSFILPHYVEQHINDNNIKNIGELIFHSFSAMFLAPLTEEFLFRGIILQKWSTKWGVKSGILSSSLLFAILHFRFDVISLFLSGILYSILYFKTRNLMTPFLCHFFYNTFVTILNIIEYFSVSAIQRNASISVKDYQNLVQPLLGQRVFLLAISVALLIYFVYKNFPKNDAIIPYYFNDEKTR